MGGDSVLSGEVSRVKKRLQRGRQRTGTNSAVWGAVGFIIAALLGVLLAANAGESPFSGKSERKDEIANFKLSLQDLEQKLATVSQSRGPSTTTCDEQAEKLRAELETTMKSMRTDHLAGVL